MKLVTFLPLLPILSTLIVVFQCADVTIAEGLSAAQEVSILERHNALRAAQVGANLGPLVWNSTVGPT